MDIEQLLHQIEEQTEDANDDFCAFIRDREEGEQVGLAQLVLNALKEHPQEYDAAFVLLVLSAKDLSNLDRLAELNLEDLLEFCEAQGSEQQRVADRAIELLQSNEFDEEKVLGLLQHEFAEGAGEQDHAHDNEASGSPEMPAKWMLGPNAWLGLVQNVESEQDLEKLAKLITDEKTQQEQLAMHKTVIRALTQTNDVDGIVQHISRLKEAQQREHTPERPVPPRQNQTDGQARTTRSAQPVTASRVRSQGSWFGNRFAWIREIEWRGLISVRNIAFVVVIFVLAVGGFLAWQTDLFGFFAPGGAPLNTGPEAIVTEPPFMEIPATQAPSVTQTNPFQEEQSTEQGVAPPDVALLPQEQALVSTCAGGYVTSVGTVNPAFEGERGYKLASLEAKHAGPPLKSGPTYTFAPVAVPGWVLAQTENGAYFFPAESFVVSQSGLCTEARYVPGFRTALYQTAIRPGLSVTLLDPSGWQWIGWLCVLLIALAIALELMLKRSYEPVLVLALSILFNVMLISVAPEKQFWLFLSGLLANYAGGSKKALREVSAVRKHSSQVGESRQVSEALNARGFIRGTDWSQSAWYCVLNLVWTIVSYEGSPLSIQFGPFWAAIILGVLTFVFFGLEAVRRGEDSDRNVVLGSTILAIAVGAAIYFLTGWYLVVAILVTTLIAVGGMMIIGFSDMDYVDRDRIPEGICMFGGLILVALIIL